MAHHATIVFGRLTDKLRGSLPQTAIYQTYHSLTIDEARRLKEEQTRTLAEKEERVYVLEAAQVTIEAQQALLKTFEEPTRGYRFLLIVPEGTRLLPTLLSRAEVIRSRDQEANLEAGAWLRATPEKRLELIADLIDQAPEAGAARAAALELVRGLAQELGPRRTQELADLNLALSCLARRSGLPRLVLEHLALVLPLC